jgi:hypothetical protein
MGDIPRVQSYPLNTATSLRGEIRCPDLPRTQAQRATALQLEKTISRERRTRL